MDLSLMAREALAKQLLACACDLPHMQAPSFHQIGSGDPRQAGSQDSFMKAALGFARELLLSGLQRDLAEKSVCSSPAQMREWLRTYCAGLENEVFLVFYLDTKNRLIDVETMFRGTLTQTAVYPREVVKIAMARNASTLMFAHNHPSGDAQPSRADESLTARLKDALALIDVRVLDHFVVGRTEVVSFAERGLL